MLAETCRWSIQRRTEAFSAAQRMLPSASLRRRSASAFTKAFLCVGPCDASKCRVPTFSLLSGMRLHGRM